MVIREHLENWFRSSGFEVANGEAITDSGYGSGGIIIDLSELEKELAEAIVRKVGGTLQDMRQEKLLTQADGDEVYSRVRLLFVDPDWMPGT